jgi:GT2 family glycosyltransferase
MPKDLLSVVVCSYNRADSLALALRSVVAQHPATHFDLEVVVVDDGSTDHTRQTVESIASEAPIPVRHVYEGSRGGIAVARNRGVHEARGAWVVFFDDDQLADAQWLEALHAVAREHGAQCVGGARRLDLPAETLARLGPICRGILGENLYTGAPAVLTGKELPTTGSLLVSRAVFDAIGGFDATLATSGEDTDFISRARRAGFAVWTAPGSMVAHMIPPHRQERPYFRWVSLRWGNQFATLDAKHHGRLWMLCFGFARGVQALCLNVPRLLFARLRGDAAGAIDRWCLLWRAWGYFRTAAHVVAPTLFPQRNFRAFLEFRGERALFARPQKSV